MKARRGVELFCMNEDNDLKWYDCSGVYFNAYLNDIPLQSKSYGIPVIPLGKRIWMDNEENNL